jgi:glutamate-5-semialdehyde dehydrogenase
MNINEIGRRAKDASLYSAKISTEEKNRLLFALANDLESNIDEILTVNGEDVKLAKSNGVKSAFIDRLTLNEKRVREMADGLREVAALPDPIGEMVRMNTLPNGLKVGQRRVPMGVIGIIFEARPNVTADAFGLCLKAGSATILKGGSNALRTNTMLVDIFRKTLSDNGAPEDLVQLISDTSYETANEMMRLNDYIDVLIPRGSGRLISSVVENSTVPVIRTGEGNCHAYVDETADIDMAINIVLNGKVQRPGVCNALETLLVHENIADAFVPRVTKALIERDVEVRGDAAFQKIEGVCPAREEDFATEYEDYIISCKVVKNLDEAIKHIRRYSTGHSEAIITENYTNAQRFLDEVDSACVYVNASTRFTDGNQFGFGAEIGISTQKLHARGPMGLKELTTTKYIIYGSGQIRK